MAASFAIPPVGHAAERRDHQSASLYERYCRDGARAAPLSRTRSCPDIKYTPDFLNYLVRASTRLHTENLETEVPTGWPRHLETPLAWSGIDFETEESCIYHLSEEEKADINNALEHFKELELNGDEVTRQTFPLQTLDKHLEQSRYELSHGKGFAIIRGIDPKDYSAEDITVIFLGISSYISEIRGKQESGRVLIHIVDCATACNRPGHPPTKHSNIAQPFHTDSVCGIIAMLTRSSAARRGGSTIASSSTIYNELAATRPDLIHVLAKNDWPMDNFGRNPPYNIVPLLHQHTSIPILHFARPPLTGHHGTPRSDNIPSLTNAQAEALDAVHFIATAHQLTTSMQPGDIRFINNMTMIHGREAFDDSAESKRHIVRMWLGNELEGKEQLPVALKAEWERVFADTEREELWEIEPPVVDWKVVRHFGSHGD